MIKSITVTNYLGDSIKIVLARPEESGFAVTKIQGLGPGKATLNMTEVATKNGSRFNSSRVSSRNIIISLQYMWKDSIEEVRQLSYKYFPLQKPLKLLIETDKRLVEIEGYVESNEPDIFSKDESSDISIICPDPSFYSAGEGGTNTTVFSGVEPMFEFPFSNESLTEPLLEFSTIHNRKEECIVYDGDVEVGVTIYIHAIGEASNVTIYNTKTREIMRINTEKLQAMTGSGIIASDDIVICTTKDQKSVKLIRAGVETNILNCLDRKPDWFQLQKGDNVFAYITESGSSNLQFKIENKVAYEGV